MVSPQLNDSLETRVVTEAMEITTFKLLGHLIEAFAKANADIDVWLTK
jgi:hypothetical protein